MKTKKLLAILITMGMITGMTACDRIIPIPPMKMQRVKIQQKIPLQTVQRIRKQQKAQTAHVEISVMYLLQC